MANIEMRQIGEPTVFPTAVSVIGAEKCYKLECKVLDGITVHVPIATIYGLLGSSGCGKTTILSCILGQQKLDHGDIFIFGDKAGSRSSGVPGRNVGYMPQDISLYTEFSIQQNLAYFGGLAGMHAGEIKVAANYLAKLLNLPGSERRINTLSGGQQRRVSLATALIHNPKLLILDEPTVGLDPLIRERVWIHLKELVTIKQTTVIITTHYIDECGGADLIGFMRDGRLFVQNSPAQLYRQFGSRSLEAILLLVCKGNSESIPEASSSRTSVPAINTVYEYSKSSSPYLGLVPNEAANSTERNDSSIASTWRRIISLAGKNLIMLIRNPLLLSFIFLPPAILLILICLALGKPPRPLGLGVLNKEIYNLTVCHSVFRVPGECATEMLSCHFLSNIPEDAFNLKWFTNDTDAVREVQNGDIWGFITFSARFSENLVERMTSGSNVEDAIINDSQITLRLDETSSLVCAEIKKVLYDALEDFLKLFLTDCGLDSRQGEFPMKYGRPIFGTDDTDFRQYLAPSVAVTILFAYSIVNASLRIVREKKSGVLARSVVSGVKFWEIIAAYLMTEFLVLTSESVLSYGIITIIFGTQVMGSSLLLILEFILSAYTGVALGCLIGVVCNEEFQAAVISIAIFFASGILTGMFWPLEGMLVWFQYICQLLPPTLVTESARSITSRGWELTHANVWPGFIAPLALIGLLLILATLFRRF